MFWASVPVRSVLDEPAEGRGLELGHQRVVDHGHRELPCKLFMLPAATSGNGRWRHLGADLARPILP